MRWLRRLKRRQPGIYAYRTRRHLQPWRTEWGYVGKSRYLESRHADHGGTGRYGEAEKPWWDLVMRRVTLRLPWWLGFDFITLSLETLVILALRPRYNWQKNPRRDKAGPRTQRTERTVRDLAPTTYRARIQARRALSMLIRVTAISVILIGIGGYIWTRSR